MITESQWAKFAQHVSVGSRFKWTYEDHQACGVLLENYPHVEKSTPVESPWEYIDLLQVKFDDGEDGTILAKYERFWIEAWDGWYDFDDIIADEDALPFDGIVNDPHWNDQLESVQNPTQEENSGETVVIENEVPLFAIGDRVRVNDHLIGRDQKDLLGTEGTVTSMGYWHAYYGHQVFVEVDSISDGMIYQGDLTKAE